MSEIDDFKELEQAKKQLSELAYGKEKAPKIDDLRNQLAKSVYDARKNQIASQLPLFEKRRGLIKDIDQFWYTTLLKSQLHQQIEEGDHEALKHLQDVFINYQDDFREYTITFTFSENPFFKETELKKVFKVSDAIKKAAPYDLDAPVDAEATTITWKDDKHNLIKASPRPNVTEMEEYDEFDGTGSFFHFFTSTEDSYGAGDMLEAVFENALDIFAGFDGLDGVDDEDDDEEEDSEDDAEEVDLGDSETDMPKKKKQKST